MQMNEVWALDFMRDTLYDGKPFRTLNLIDEVKREALRIECGTFIPLARLVRAMNQLILVNGAPEAIRMKNGHEMTSEKITEWAKKGMRCCLFILANPIRMHLLSDSTEALGLKFSIRIYSTQLQRLKRPLMFR